MLYREIIAVLFSVPHKTCKYNVWAECRYFKRYSLSYIKQALGFKGYLPQTYVHHVEKTASHT